MRNIIIQKPGRADRMAALPGNSFTLGADLGCDIVLVEAGFASEHLSFRVGEEAIEVDVLGAGELSVGPRSGPDRAFQQGDTLSLKADDRIKIGDVEIFIQGFVFPKRSTPWASRVVVASVGVFLVGMTWSTVSYSNILSGPDTPLEYSRVDAINDTAETVRNNFAKAGFAAVAVQNTSAGLTASGVVETEAEKATARQFANSLPYDLHTQFHSVEKQRRAVSMVLEVLQVDADIHALKGGDLVLGGLFDGSISEKLKRTLLADIPGLKSVQFGTFSEANTAKYMRGKVSAVWGGDSPYVRMSDGRIVYVGEEILDGITFAGIEGQKRLLLSQGAQTWSFNWYDG